MKKGETTKMNSIDEIIKVLSIKQHRYLIVFENEDMESIQLLVDQNVNRPNNPDDDCIIQKYVEYNYGAKNYDAIRLDSIKSVSIK